jgi:purine-nucleoside/S-methyl-5'-thioadenosine phosphorylase / adenosine deaminase
VLYLTSRLLSAASVPHGFSLRTGGVSPWPYQSLNLGFTVGDSKPLVEENMRRLRTAAGLGGDIATAVQVHGDRIVDSELREILPSTVPEADGADGMVSEGAAVGVRVADCVPVLLSAGRTVAAVHSGWKGTKLRIAARALAAMRVPARDVVAAVGPCIGRCCYQVSPELAAGFRAQFGAGAADERDHLDLRYCIEAALREAGVAEVEQVQGCTSCDIGSFFSHRRDKGRTGRHLAFISPAR